MWFGNIYVVRCTANNPCAQKCTDTGLAIECSCLPGYELARDAINCLGRVTFHYYVNTVQWLHSSQIWVELQMINNPRTRLEWSNMVFITHCYPLIWNNWMPKDIDECAVGVDTCDLLTQRCINTEGSFTCQNRDRSSGATHWTPYAQRSPSGGILCTYNFRITLLMAN